MVVYTAHSLGKFSSPPGSAVTYLWGSAQSSGGASLKQVMPSTSQSMLASMGGLWSLKKRAILRAESGLGCDRASPARGPFLVPDSRQTTPKGPIRPHRRVQLQWNSGSRALLNKWNLVSWGPILCSHWSRRRKLWQAWWVPVGGYDCKGNSVPPGRPH